MWSEYISDLVDDDKYMRHLKEAKTGPSIVKKEVAHAIQVGKKLKLLSDSEEISNDILKLMNYMLKLFLQIIHSIIYKKFEEPFKRTELGFRNGFGTGEALVSVNVLIQKRPTINCNVH